MSVGNLCTGRNGNDQLIPVPYPQMECSGHMRAVACAGVVLINSPVVKGIKFD